MKQFILSALAAIFTLLFTLFPLQPQRTEASAQTPTYACILTNDAYLYASSNERSGLFLLPKTYYVKALSVGAEFTKVEYQSDGDGIKAITGYCKTEQLTFVDYIPKTPYFHTFFDVTYTIADADKSYPFLTEITVRCAYYGEYPIGSDTYCYVLREDGFGYVPKPENLNFIENTEYADRLAQAAPPTEQTPVEQEEPQTLPPTQIATIFVLCLLAPILAALILRSNKSAPLPDDD